MKRCARRLNWKILILRSYLNLPNRIMLIKWDVFLWKEYDSYWLLVHFIQYSDIYLMLDIIIFFVIMIFGNSCDIRKRSLLKKIVRRSLFKEKKCEYWPFFDNNLYRKWREWTRFGMMISFLFVFKLFFWKNSLIKIMIITTSICYV